MSNPPFKVKAVHDYSSPHEDDLSFPSGQVITVTEEEDADWYIGQYTSDAGDARSGLFPKNFVEKYEPEVPSRPTRVSRPKAAAAAEEPTVAPIAAPLPASAAAEAPQTEEPRALPVENKPAAPAQEPTAISAAEPEPEHEQATLPGPAPELEEQQPPRQPPSTTKASPAPSSAKGPPPPVSEKPSSFKDRIAAFNKQEKPVAPIKPSAPPGGSTGFIKKPFVAPPPSRSAYVPPPKAEPVQKVYKREEDPEIAEKQAQDQHAAAAAGLISPETAQQEEGDEDAPKPQSLKDRIALLQRQQVEQAQRRADAAQKEKPRKPTKKRAEESEGISVEDETAGELARVRSGEQQIERVSEDRPRDVSRVSTSRTAPPPMSPSSIRGQDILSDGNEADQSAAGEITEGNEDTSDTEEGEQTRVVPDPVHLARAPAAPKQEPDVGEEEGTTEGEQEDELEDEEADGDDEMDEETRRRVELRERMAKMSGGMGMAGMFGPQPGMAMPGAMPQKSRSVKSTKSSREPEVVPASPPQVPQPRIPMIPVPSMQQVTSPQSDDTQMAVEKEDEPAGRITDERQPDEVPDLEDVKVETPSRASTSAGELASDVFVELY